MDSRDKFKDAILAHYKSAVGEELPENLLVAVVEKVADHYYEQYKRFSQQYPKSIKRYSTFQEKDLDHPYTKKIIITFFKDALGVNYKESCKLLLGLNDDELRALEQWWEDYERYS